MVKLVREKTEKDYNDDVVAVYMDATYHYDTREEQKEHCQKMLQEGYKEGSSVSFLRETEDGRIKECVATYYSKQETVKNCTSENTEKIF